MKKIDTVLGVMNFTGEAVNEDALRLQKEREVLRKAGNWKASNEIRGKLLEMGIEVSDTASRMMWRVKWNINGMDFLKTIFCYAKALLSLKRGWYCG